MLASVFLCSCCSYASACLRTACASKMLHVHKQGLLNKNNKNNKNNKKKIHNEIKYKILEILYNIF
jgi:hypothetical protein